jgi:beta-N-acetylhexosaminidase
MMLSACALLAGAVAGCGGGAPVHLISRADEATSTRRTPAHAPAATIADRTPNRTTDAVRASIDSQSPIPASAMSASRLVGQLLMSHVTGLSAGPGLLARIRRGQVGSVILYSENISSDSQLISLTSSLQRAARAGHNPPLLIGTDQEGGSVKRIQNGPPTLSAEQMGATAEPFTVAERQGDATGAHLRRLGINLDFAPVSDVPTTSDNFLKDRAFGHSANIVMEAASGFAQGLADAHVAASAKHFPGLGAAGPRDSDFTLVSIAASKNQLQLAYAPYIAMAQLGGRVAPMVMISDASYPALDPSGLPAVLSSRIIHSQLAVAAMSERVTITDDLEVPSVEQYSAPAVKALSAGDDILMFAQHEAGSERAFAEVRTALAQQQLSKSLIQADAEKVVALKKSLPAN